MMYSFLGILGNKANYIQKYIFVSSIFCKRLEKIHKKDFEKQEETRTHCLIFGCYENVSFPIKPQTGLLKHESNDYT